MGVAKNAAESFVFIGGVAIIVGNVNYHRDIRKINRMNWHVYIVECSDGTLYTGISHDVDKRIREHNLGIGSKYTRGRRPVKLLATWSCAGKSHASKMEYRIKGLTREAKLKLIINGRV